jgi:hypothetical protein
MLVHFKTDGQGGGGSRRNRLQNPECWRLYKTNPGIQSKKEEQQHEVTLAGDEIAPEQVTEFLQPSPLVFTLTAELGLQPLISFRKNEWQLTKLWRRSRKDSLPEIQREKGDPFKMDQACFKNHILAKGGRMDRGSRFYLGGFLGPP